MPILSFPILTHQDHLKPVMHLSLFLCHVELSCLGVVVHPIATEYSKFLTDQELKIHFGWSKNSLMPGLYSHLSGRDVDMKIISFFNHNPPHVATNKIREHLGKEDVPSYIG